MYDKIINHVFLDDSVMQLEVLTGMYLGSCVISRNSFPGQYLPCTFFLPKGTERATSSVAKVQLVSVVRDTREDWSAGMAREGKIEMSCESMFTAKGGRKKKCGRASHVFWESSYCLRGCASGREEGNQSFYFKGCYGC